MPVLFDSASWSPAYINPGATSGSTSAPHNVSPAAEDVVAIAGLLWTGQADTSGATFGMTFGGQAMDPLDDAQRWNSNKEFFRAFILEDPPDGTQTVVGSFASMPTEFNARGLMIVCATFANVESVGEAVAATVTSTANNSVTVPSVLPAHRVVTLHAAGNGVFNLGNYNKKLRAYAGLNQQLLAAGGSLLIGDADGAASVVATATQNASDRWGAIGVSLAPTVVEAAAQLTVDVVTAASGGTYRTATPAPARYYGIPPIGHKGDSSLVAGDFVTGADGVLMPIWIKDPHDIEDYTLDWSNLLVEDDHIISVTFTPTSSALNVVSANIGETVHGRTDAATSVWFSGGVAGVNYGVVCHIVTAEGRQHDRTFRIVGGQK